MNRRNHHRTNGAYFYLAGRVEFCTLPAWFFSGLVLDSTYGDGGYLVSGAAGDENTAG